MQKEIPVIVTTIFTQPTSPFDRFDDFYANAGRLEAAGVEFCIAREGREGNLDTKLLPIQAGMAVAHGLSADRAVRAITIDAARILGVESQIGSLEPGKVADVIVTTGDPTQASTRKVASFIAGVPMDLGSLELRWRAQIDLADGVRSTYQWFCDAASVVRGVGNRERIASTDIDGRGPR